MNRLKYISFIFGTLLFAIGVFQSVHANLPASVNGQPLPSLAPMLEKATPAVVNIATVGIRRSHHPIYTDPLFEHFFGNRIPSQHRTRASGSGVIIDAAKGHIVTNYHVVAGANSIVVTLNDGRKASATVIGTDPRADIAVIKIKEKGLVALPLGNSDQLRVGDFVVAIGNPYGLGQSVTSGIISALGRTDLGIEDYEDFIQTDASINPGNSGGALVDLNGRLIGINTAILGGDGGGNVGIGFAIPVNMVKNIVKQLVTYGQVERGQLGVVVQDLDHRLAKALGTKDSHGAVIVEVVYGSPADLAGLRSGDVITHINGKKVKNANDVRNKVGTMRIGTRINLDIFRNGRSKNLTAVIGKTDTHPRPRLDSPIWDQ